MSLDGLAGRTVLVTGGSRGIGRAIGIAFAQVGANVAVTYRTNETEARETVEQIVKLGRRGIALKVEATVASEVAALIDTVERELGMFPVLVNNAGVIPAQSFETMTEREWDEVLAVNLKSVFLMIQAALPRMRSLRWGRIINISSVAAQVGGVAGPHYAASKAGIFGLTHYYAAQLAKEGITVNTVAPGPISTDLVSGLPELRPYQMPIGRFGTPEEVAEVVVMLARNGNITGQTFNVNGGRHMS